MRKPTDQEILRAAASIMGKRGGAMRSKAKKRAAGINGQLGGRPKQYPPCPKQYGKNKAHRFSPRTGRCPCGYVKPNLN